MPELLDEALALWQDCPETLPPFDRTFSSAEHSAKEAELDLLMQAIEAEMKRLPANRSERFAAWERINRAFARFASQSAGLREPHLELMLGGGLSSIGTRLARQARAFDPGVSTSDIFQASRNAWAACGLQILFGQPMSLTPSIFAYSMLYPYTDNYLDDASIPGEQKAGFGERFGRRLAGARPEPANPYEAILWRLVGLIEGQYDRPAHPGVFGSLLRIHRAQLHSLRLRRSAPGATDILRLVFEKGGSSVLADGYLAAGELSAPQARFAYLWGVLLQLADDLQDLRQDLDDGALTLFSECAGRAPLDALTNRTLHLTARVMNAMTRLDGEAGSPIQELIARSSLSLLVRSAGEAGEWYTPAYLAEMERHSPFRFSFLAERRRRMLERRALLARLFEAFLAGDDDEPGFPLLPNSLLPS